MITKTTTLLNVCSTNPFNSSLVIDRTCEPSLKENHLHQSIQERFDVLFCTSKVNIKTVPKNNFPQQGHSMQLSTILSSMIFF